MTRQHGGPRRAGFTVIELLVVIAIIAALAGFLLSAVQRVRVSAKKTQTVNDISQLSNAVAAFKTRYQVSYIPSKIRLRANMGSYGTGALDRDSKDYLLQVWPRLDPNATGLKWNGTGGGPFDLEGDQCLVFFLGGIPRGTPPVPGGFSKNPTNPTDTNAGFDPPFFEFPVNRLVNLRGATAGADRFLSFIDPFEVQPYLYFSSYGTPNGYSKYGSSDISIGSVAPYIEATSPKNKFFQANGFQIISAGADKQFGPGGFITLGSVTGPAQDDLSNFSTGQLGAGP